MKISTRGRYALRFMIDLAQHDSTEYTALKDISERQEISIKYLEQITSLLSKFGLLQSVRGPQGGYKLAKKPAEYTVGEILRITEGDLSPVACLAQTENTCPKRKDCPTLDLWSGLNKVINDYLNSKTLEDLVDSACAKKNMMMQLPHIRKPHPTGFRTTKAIMRFFPAEIFIRSRKNTMMRKDAIKVFWTIRRRMQTAGTAQWSEWETFYMSRGNTGKPLRS